MPRLRLALQYLGRNAVYIALLVIFAVWAGLVFQAKSRIPQDQTSTIALLEGMELLLSVAIGWVLQHLYSQGQFEKDLRRYAFSAYRRITDIGKFVSRIEATIKRQIGAPPPNPTHGLEILQAIAGDLADTVRSSAADWAEIIGEEIQKLERLRELEEQRESASRTHPPPSVEEASAKLNDVETEIAQLRSDIPIYLQMAVERQGEILPREGRFSRLVYEHFRQGALTQGYFTIPVERQVEGPIDVALQELRHLAPYYLSEDVAAGSSYLGLYGSDESYIGLVENPFEAGGVYYRDFLDTLYMFLPRDPHEFESGLPTLSMPGAEVHSIDPQQGKIYIRIPIDRANLPEPPQVLGAA